MTISDFVEYLLLGGGTPGENLRHAHVKGVLRELLPEVDMLYGVPQPEEHHPEIDTGWHIELCLDRIAQLSAGFDVEKRKALLYAVLLHDVGKALTKEVWPAHHQHEALGVPVVEKINSRSGMSEYAQKLASLMCEHHLRVHVSLTMSNKGIIRLLQSVPEEYCEDLFLAGQADAQGRRGLSEDPYPQYLFLTTLTYALKQQSMYPTADEDLTTREQQDMHKRRLTLISQIQQKYKE